MSDTWKTVRLGDVCRIIPGYAFKSSDWQSQGIPVVKIKNIKADNTVDLSDVDCVPVRVRLLRCTARVTDDMFCAGSWCATLCCISKCCRPKNNHYLKRLSGR